MASDNRAYLTCLTANIIPPLPSVVRRCIPCLEQHGTVTDLWVSHAMVDPVDSGGVTPICMACTEVSMDARKEWVAMVAPEQVADLANLGLLGFADQFTTHVNRTRQWPWSSRA